MKQAFVAVLVTAVLVGCATTVYNVDNHATPLTARQLSLDQIERAIVEAGRRRGWQFEHVEPGHLLATLTRYQHKAAADVLFTQKDFSIVHNASLSTGPKGEAGVIHPRYNRWIQNLENDIVLRLSNTVPD